MSYSRFLNHSCYGDLVNLKIYFGSVDDKRGGGRRSRGQGWEVKVTVEYNREHFCWDQKLCQGDNFSAKHVESSLPLLGRCGQK